MNNSMIRVSALGPAWIQEVRGEVQARRDGFAAAALCCHPDGAYRKQLEMVIAELDAMLAAPSTLK